jgi:hypothetical protein
MTAHRVGRTLLPLSAGCMQERQVRGFERPARHGPRRVVIDPLQRVASSGGNDRSTHVAGVCRFVVETGDRSKRSLKAATGDGDEPSAQQPLSIGATVLSRPTAAAAKLATKGSNVPHCGHPTQGFERLQCSESSRSTPGGFGAPEPQDSGPGQRSFAWVSNRPKGVTGAFSGE